MAIQRMDNVAIVVADLEAAIAFFVALGLSFEGRASIEGRWVDRIVGLDGVRTEIAMMRTPDGHSRLELTKYLSPNPVVPAAEPAPSNTMGLHRIMFTVDDIEDTIVRLRDHGGELLGEVVAFEGSFRLCYLRGPSGIVVALAEPIK